MHVSLPFLCMSAFHHRLYDRVTNMWPVFFKHRLDRVRRQIYIEAFIPKGWLA